MPGDLTPAQFVAKWSQADLSERAASQEHFIDLCRLLGQPTPAEHDATGAEYTFEKGVPVMAGASKGAKGEFGFADVWWRGKFAWEYKRKGKYKNLDDAYRQLCQYREALENPPLLIVSDIARTEIHTNFTGTAAQVHTIELAELAEPVSLDLLRRVFLDPESFRPTITPEAVTEAAAQQIGKLAQALRDRGHDPHQTAHFLMKCMFCLFAEDVGLLPGKLFEKTVRLWRSKPPELAKRLTELFGEMRTGGAFGPEEIAFFNGGLFDESPALEITEDQADVLLAAAKQDWATVEPAIFGTLFERSLDPNTRAQIGAHYTSKTDILLVVEPVVMAPLRREWEGVKEDIATRLERRQSAKTKPTQKRINLAIEDLIRGFIHRLSSVRVLDPACGSGNFLYVAIQQLLGLEKEVITHAASPEIGVGLFPQVRPTQLLGIEINPYAAELAQVVIWIGYLQWMRDNGFNAPRNPILEPIQSIECRDAILDRLPDAPPEPLPSGSADPEPRRSRSADPEPRPSRSADPEPRPSGRAERAGGTYLLTWTTYGTWLPGDERGFVSRIPDRPKGHVIHNLPGEPYDMDMPDVARAARSRQKGPSVKLTKKAAAICVAAFREVADTHGVEIHAGAVMATHAHLVVSSAGADGPKLLNLFKGVASRRLSQALGKPSASSWWTRHGSRRLLRDAKALDNAVSYVRNQEAPLEAVEYEPAGLGGGSPADDPRDVNVAQSPSRDVHVARTQSRCLQAARIPRDLKVAARAGPATWPEAEFIIGNPPFLGSKLFRQQGLEDDYIQDMFAAFELPNSSDLCCYWFELARQAIKKNANTRAGLLATQGIRGGDNRAVLRRIKQTGDIFTAWSDRKWILDGAAVHVSIVGFDTGNEQARVLDRVPVQQINADLTADLDLDGARVLDENRSIAFMGDTKGGQFDIEADEARQVLPLPNPNGRANTDVLRPWVNGADITQRTRAKWIIDFGCDMPEATAAQYEAPFRTVRERVWPTRRSNRRAAYAERWWIHVEPRPALRAAVEPLPRFVVTTRVAKHRVFRWFVSPTLPDSATFAFARSDDYFLGVLHSSVHELWARRQGTQLREAESGFRYTPTTCFETFPLPWSPGAEPVPPSRDLQVARSPSSDGPAIPTPSRDVHVARNTPRCGTHTSGESAQPEGCGSGVYQRIADAAEQLNAQRERWLNPPEWIEPIAAAVDAEDDFADVPQEARELIRQSAIMARAAKDKNLKKRTLTNLYNERPTWLRLAHEKLDRAVLAAYAGVDPEGEWPEDWAAVWVETGAGQPLSDGHALADLRNETDQRVLANLLRMNLQRAGGR